MAKKSLLELYANQRAKYYSKLSEHQLEVHRELQQLVNDRVKDFSVKQEQVTAEINEYERHFTGYFALAISFIVSGLLSNQVPGHDTRALKVFFLSTIIICLLAALLLFFEYILSYRLFNNWQANIKKSIDYINGGNWGNPAKLDEWLATHQSEVKEKSTHKIQKIEIGLMCLAFTMLICWLAERLFNPNWPLLN